LRAISFLSAKIVDGGKLAALAGLAASVISVVAIKSAIVVNPCRR